MTEKQIKLEFLKKQNDAYTVYKIDIQSDTVKVYAMLNMQCFIFTYKINKDKLEYVTHSIVDYTDFKELLQ